MSSLRGLRVVLTRGAERDATLATALRDRGATVFELPCVRIEPLGDARPLASAVRALGPEDWLVLTSANGADAVLRAVPPAEIRARIAAVGEQTASALRRAGLGVWRPSRQNAEALADELPRMTGRALLARADRAGAELPARLRERGFTVTDVVAYRTVPHVADVGRAAELLAPGAVDAVVFASPSALEGLLTACGPDDIARHVVVAIGPTTARAVRASLGREPIVADAPSIDGFLRAITSIEVRHVASA